MLLRSRVHNCIADCDRSLSLTADRQSCRRTSVFEIESALGVCRTGQDVWGRTAVSAVTGIVRGVEMIRCRLDFVQHMFKCSIIIIFYRLYAVYLHLRA